LSRPFSLIIMCREKMFHSKSAHFKGTTHFRSISFREFHDTSGLQFFLDNFKFDR
jgi:hypothetical protein